jgi:hypothetical protein
MVPKQINHGPADRSKLSPRKIAKYAGLAFGAVILVCVLVFLFFPDTYINGYLKNQIIRAFAKAYPAYSIRIAGVHYNLWENRIGCDSIALTSNDSTFSCSIAKFSLSGIGWVPILWRGEIASKDLNGSVADVREMVLSFRQSQYELRCARLRVSVPGSEIWAETLELHPLVEDDKFFAGSKFRRTRFRIVLPQCRVTGADCLGLLQGKTYRARSVKVNDASFDILVDMDTPYNKNSSRPLMPNEGLSSINKMTQIDNLSIMNGRLKYAERYIIGSAPAEVTFDSIQMSAEGITNQADPGATAVIHAQANFMKTSMMKILMVIPVISPGISFRYSGSLDRMDATRLNSFLEVGESLRIKSGILQNATFDVNVTAGRASGTVRLMYRDLAIAFRNSRTGSERGTYNRVTSYIANATKIRGTNMPDKSGSMKIGKVNYTRKADDTFLQLVWFSLRSGVGDVVGF